MTSLKKNSNPLPLFLPLLYRMPLGRVPTLPLGACLIRQSIAAMLVPFPCDVLVSFRKDHDAPKPFKTVLHPLAPVLQTLGQLAALLSWVLPPEIKRLL